jgi:predicted kinase
VLVLPVGLVLLVGPPAAGKSTFARGLVRLGRIEAAGVVSADAIRARLFGAAVRVADDPAVFAEVDARVAARLAGGLPVMLDATNVTPAARRRARSFSGTISALRFSVADEVLIARNAARPVPVAADVVAGLTAAFRESASLDRLRSEGYAVTADAPAPELVTFAEP